MKRLNTLVWDWNGTLLDDVDLCIRSINKLLSDRKLECINHEFYLQVFGFPVVDYYKRIGFRFDKEPFEVPANQFIELYSENLSECSLHHGVKPLLENFQMRGYRQVILSAMEQSKLEASISQLGIRHCFEAVAGLDHDYATSKEAIGKQLFEKLGIDASEAIMIGDTLHDFEISEALGCQCVLVACGHQAHNVLTQANVPILEKLEDLNDFLKNKAFEESLTNVTSSVYP